MRETRDYKIRLHIKWEISNHSKCPEGNYQGAGLKGVTLAEGGGSKLVLKLH